MSDIFGKLKSGASKAAFDADKMMRIRKVEGEVTQIKKQMDNFQERLGEITYLSYVNKEPQNQDAIDYCEKLMALEQQIVVKQEEIKSIQGEIYGQAPTSAPVVTNFQKCPSCGKMNAANTKFCAECGVKMT